MDINRSRVDSWKTDIEDSVDYYNNWFMEFAPPTFKEARRNAMKDVNKAFRLFGKSSELSVAMLAAEFPILPILRQMTCPPLARDRLAGLSKVSSTFVKRLEDSPCSACGNDEEKRIIDVIKRLLDVDLFPFLKNTGNSSSPAQRNRAALIVADRLCGALSDPLIRNEQERRQLSAISDWLHKKKYELSKAKNHMELKPGEFAYHLNVKVALQENEPRTVNIPVDVAIMPKSARKGDLPLIMEAKSAGDFANVNKRRKEEAQKISQLRRTYGEVSFVLFLCGYFDAGYLGYEASEGIDWIWEHRIADMEKLGL